MTEARLLALAMLVIWIFIFAYGWQIDSLKKRVAQLEQALSNVARRP